MPVKPKLLPLDDGLVEPLVERFYRLMDSRVEDACGVSARVVARGYGHELAELANVESAREFVDAVVKYGASFNAPEFALPGVLMADRRKVFNRAKTRLHQSFAHLKTWEDVQDDFSIWGDDE